MSKSRSNESQELNSRLFNARNKNQNVRPDILVESSVFKPYANDDLDESNRVSVLSHLTNQFDPANFDEQSEFSQLHKRNQSA